MKLVQQWEQLVALVRYAAPQPWLSILQPFWPSAYLAVCMLGYDGVQHGLQRYHVVQYVDRWFAFIRRYPLSLVALFLFDRPICYNGNTCPLPFSLFSFSREVRACR